VSGILTYCLKIYDLGFVICDLDVPMLLTEINQPVAQKEIKNPKS